MSDIQITAKSDEIEKAVKMLAGVPGGAQKALSLALNRSLDSAKSEAVRAVAEEYTVKQKQVRPTMRAKKSSASNLEAEIVSTGASLPLMEFKVAPRSDTTGNRRQPIRVQVKKGGGGKLTRSFIHKGRVYEREGETRLPIRPLSGPAVPVMLNNEQVVERVEKKAIETVEKRLDHEVGRLLDKAVK